MYALAVVLGYGQQAEPHQATWLQHPNKEINVMS
jgi:hypothetical protein